MTDRQWATLWLIGAALLGPFFISSPPLGPLAWAGEKLAFSEFKGQQGPADAGQFVATTNDQWLQLWSLIGQEPPKPLVEGDQTGVAIFMGEQPTGGYQIHVKRVEADNGRIEVKTSTITPTEVAAAGTTAPYVILLIDGAGRKVVLDKRQELQEPDEESDDPGLR